MTNQSPREGWEERFDKEFFIEKHHAIKKEVVLKTTGDPGVAEIMNILIKDQLTISGTQLKSFIAEAIEEARKEGARELGAYNLTCPYLPGNPNQNKLCDAWHRGVQDRQALIETALKEMSGEKE